jgi:hypothetical protein
MYDFPARDDASLENGSLLVTPWTQHLKTRYYFGYAVIISDVPGFTIILI